MKIIQPTYTLKLPITNKVISYRPFTIKEEKSLLLALEENDLDTVAETIKNLVYACTDGRFDTDKSPYYETEYVFLNIRAKSVGEYIDLIGKCECKADTKFAADISKTKLINADHQKTSFNIIGTKYKVVMQYPSLHDFINVIRSDDNGIPVVAKCIKQITEGDEELDFSLKEKIDFIESMTPIQQSEISKFIDNMPTVVLDASYVCTGCGKEHTHFLSGFENFFV